MLERVPNDEVREIVLHNIDKLSEDFKPEGYDIEGYAGDMTVIQTPYGTVLYAPYNWDPERLCFLKDVLNIHKSYEDRRV